MYWALLLRNTQVACKRVQSHYPWFSLVLAAAAAVTSINMSRSCLLPQHAAGLEEQLRKFLSLKHLDLSGNAGLDSGAVAVIVKALAGEGAPRCISSFIGLRDC